MSEDQTQRSDQLNRRDFGRDGVSGMADKARAIRAREISQPTPDDIAQALNEAPQIASEAISRRTQQKR